MVSEKLPVPTESDEQKVLVHWMTLNNIKFFRVPNETYTKSWKQKANNKALGVVRGVPDLFVIVNNKLIAIELKRQKRYKTTPEQEEWIDTLNDIGIPARICPGADKAIEFINEF